MLCHVDWFYLTISTVYIQSWIRFIERTKLIDTRDSDPSLGWNMEPECWIQCPQQNRLNLKSNLKIPIVYASRPHLFLVLKATDGKSLGLKVDSLTAFQPHVCWLYTHLDCLTTPTLIRKGIHGGSTTSPQCQPIVKIIKESIQEIWWSWWSCLKKNSCNTFNYSDMSPCICITLLVNLGDFVCKYN